MKEINYREMIETAGIKEGMTIDIVIDLFDVAKQCMALNLSFDSDHFIDELEDVIGENGNLLIRTFSWDWCHGKGFDSRTTASRVGALGNVAMKRKEFKRTRHPIYNWMVWGKDQQELCDIDNKESFGADSIFGWQEKNADCYQINFGKSQLSGLTVFHFVELKVGIPYRYVKDFTGTYIDDTGSVQEKTYSMNVRDLNFEIVTDDSVYEPELVEKGILKRTEYNGIPILNYKIDELMAVYEKDFRKNRIPTAVTLTPIRPENE